MRDRKKRNIIIGSLCCLLIIMGIGYAVLSQTLNISGTANMRGTWDIKITDINTKGKTKNIVFEITDQELLNLAGGIVQGMSGSPIIQGEYIVGAVTHVVIENPRKGYGIFIVNMLEEAEN